MRKRGPDILTILALLVGLGVVLTGLTQGVLRDSQAQAAQEVTQPETYRR